MGGPVNKAAYAFGVGLLSTQTYGPMAAIMAAGMVPPLAMGLATMVARRKFDKAQQEGGKAALVLGLCFISEGAIPFAARDLYRGWGADWRNLNGDWCETDGTARWSVCSADPWRYYAGIGLPGSNYCRYAGGGFGLCLPETSGSGRSSESSVIKGVLQGRNFLPCNI
ncbi:PTS system fructose-specific transporter subunit IIBC [Shigella flexneri]|nr:PTS system fructose-specific transporter subunit IIBC [Shigella flexneri]